ncbi:MAG: outer membrane beta-barrel protein [Nitrospinae bacterium]|nr:outer membrane beta-barrel protein [Nitrospinota bacterium]
MKDRLTSYRSTLSALAALMLLVWGPGFVFAQARPSPMYVGADPTPRALRFGPLELYPRAEVEEIYDDNIFLEAVDEEIDFITHYRPNIHGRLNFKDHIVEFGAMGDIADFSSNEKENYTNQAYDAGLFLNFARLSLELKGYFADTTAPSSSATLSELGPRIRHWDSESVGVLGIKLGEKAKIEFDARFYDLEYDASGLGRLERTEIGGGASFFWRIRPKTDIFVGYEYTQLDFDSITAADPQDDSESHLALGGLRFEPGPKLVGRVSAGAELRDYNSIDDHTTPAFATDLTWFATPKLTLTVFFSRKFEDSSSASDQFIRATKVAGSVRYNLTDRLMLRLEGEYDNDNYDTARDDDTGRGVGEISYFIIRDILRLSAKYERIDHDSTIEEKDYDVNRASAEVLLQY